MERNEVLEILKKSKKEFIEDRSNKINRGMCYYLYNNLGYIDYYYIRRHIPQFNPKFCEGTMVLPGYWWNLSDTDSRIEAFNKLIVYYSKPSLKEKIIELWNKIK